MDHLGLPPTGRRPLDRGSPVARAHDCGQVPSVRVAEACKILDDTYRAVKIALVIELKGVFPKVDSQVCEVIEAAKHKTFGFQAV